MSDDSASTIITRPGLAEARSNMAPMSRASVHYKNQVLLQNLRRQNLATTYQGRSFADWTVDELHEELDNLTPDGLERRLPLKLNYAERLLELERGDTTSTGTTSGPAITTTEESPEAEVIPFDVPLQVLRRAQPEAEASVPFSVPRRVVGRARREAHRRRLRLVLRTPAADTFPEKPLLDNFGVKLPTCQVCFDQLPELAFSEVPADADCTHNKTTICNGCMQAHIQAISSSHALDELPCPEVGCGAVLSYAQMRAYAPLDLFGRFDSLLNEKALASAEDFVACSNPTCGLGGIYDAGSTYIICACAARTCVTCKTAWHPSLTHEANMEEIRQAEARAEYDRLHGDDQKKTEKYLKTRTKACPKCGQPISKNLGCDHMTCRSRGGKNGKKEQTHVKNVLSDAG